MTSLPESVLLDVAMLDRYREHLAHRHDGPEGRVPSCVACEAARWYQHAVTLNTIAWKIAEALGDVPEGAEQIEGDPLEQADRLIAELEVLREAFALERLRTEMMAMQRGAVLDAVHSMQLGNHTVADVAARVEEIFKAGMAAEVKAGYDEHLARMAAVLEQARTEDGAPALTGWYCTHCPMDPITGVIEHTEACPEMPEAVRKAREELASTSDSGSGS